MYKHIVLALALALAGCVSAPSTTLPGADSTILSPIVASVAPSPSPVPTIPAWPNGSQVPSAWYTTAYQKSRTPFNTKLSSAPTIDLTLDSQIKKYYFATAPGLFALLDVIQPPASQVYKLDYSKPIYHASASDPLLTIQCGAAGGACSAPSNGMKIHVPALARPAGGTDHHMAIIDPTNTVEYDFWAVAPQGTKTSPAAGATYPAWTNGSTMYVGGAGIENLDGTPATIDGAVWNDAPGWQFQNWNAGAVHAATAGGFALSGAPVLLSELQAGQINHAMSVSLICEAAGPQRWPSSAPKSDSTCPETGAGIPEGARVWYDRTPTQIKALGLDKDSTTVLIALNQYGAFVNDSYAANVSGKGAGFSTFEKEDNTPFYAFNKLNSKGQDPFIAYALANKWNASISQVRLEPSYSVVDFKDHLRVLAPCATGTASVPHPTC